MTALHRLHRLAARMGLDVRRTSTSAPARLMTLLRRYEVDLILDIGANRGEFGRQLRAFGYAGEIVSFEPLPDAFASLSRVAASDPRWEVREVALGAENGSAMLNVADNDGASSSLLPMLRRHELAAPSSRYVGAVDVQVRRLTTIWDEVVGSALKPFMKLDVQGFEGRVLDGASEELAQLAGIQLELSVVPVYEGSPLLRQMLDRMDALDLRLVDVEPGFRDERTGEMLQFDGVFMRRVDE